MPYFLLHRSDVGLDGPRPTLLYGYGGFDIAIYAEYRPTFAGWLAAGGVLAIANLRGGGEYGAAWHGRRTAEGQAERFSTTTSRSPTTLVAEGVTTPAQVALHGGSNGGLLVGAAITQRPDVAAVALPAVGVMDMLRFHLFTIVPRGSPTTAPRTTRTCSRPCWPTHHSTTSARARRTPRRWC